MEDGPVSTAADALFSTAMGVFIVYLVGCGVAGMVAAFRVPQ